MRKFDVHTHCGRWNSIPGDRWEDDDLVALCRAAEVEQAVVSSIRAILSDVRSGNEETQRVIEKHDMLYGYIYVDPYRIPESVAQVETLSQHPKFVGLKSRDDWHHQPYNGPAYKELFRQVRHHRLPVLLHTFSISSMLAAAELAREYGAPIISTHMAGPQWRDAEAAFAASKIPPNLYVDPVSSYSEPGKYELALRVFGEDRVVFGTDCTLFHPHLAIGAIESSEITEDVKRRIYWDNPRGIFFPGQQSQ